MKLFITWKRDKNKTVLLRDIVHQTSRGKSAAAGLTNADAPKDIRLSVSHNNTVLFLSPDAKNTK